MSFSTSCTLPPLALLIHCAHLPAPTLFDSIYRGAEALRGRQPRKGRQPAGGCTALEGILSREGFGARVCAVSLEEWTSGTKDVYGGVERGYPEALISPSPRAIVHFGRDPLASSVSITTPPQLHFPESCVESEEVVVGGTSCACAKSELER